MSEKAERRVGFLDKASRETLSGPDKPGPAALRENVPGISRNVK